MKGYPSMKYWFPVFIWMALIFLMSTDLFSSGNTSSVVGPVLSLLFPGVSQETVEMVHKALRKSGHVAEYFVLGLLLFRAFRGGSVVRWQWKWVVFSILAVIAYAATDEFHQSFVPSRTASAADVAIDTAGGILSQVFFAIKKRKK